MRNVTILLAVVAVVAMAVPAWGAGATYKWNVTGGGTADWHVSTNWLIHSGGWIANTTGNCPGDTASDDQVFLYDIANAATARITGSGTINISDFVVGDYPHPGYVELTDCTRIINVSLGSMSKGFAIGEETLRSGNPGTFTQKGGTVNLNVSLDIAKNPNVPALYGHGIYEISKGSLIQASDGTEYTVAVGPIGAPGDSPGVGRFKIVGTGPTDIKLNDYSQYANSTLEIVLSAAGSVTPIQVVGTHASYGNAELDGELLLLDNLGGTPDPTGSAITILKLASTKSLDYANLDLDDDSIAKGWYLQDVAGTGADAGKTLLQVVPEPATMVLLGIGGLGVLLRRKRR